MWNFTVDGFTSVVEYDPPATHWKDGKQVTFDDGIINNLPADYAPATKDDLSTHVLVRARIKEDLDALKTYDPDAIQTEDQRADYQYRLVMRRTAYATYMYDKVMTLDYNSHVKETIDRRAPKVAGGRYQALSKIWSACAQWQPNTPWGNTVSYGGYGPGANGGTYTTPTKKNGPGKPVSHWDSSLGKWITPKNHSKEVVATGGADPKGVTGNGAKDERSQGADWPSEATLDRILDGLDPDNPWYEPSPTLPVGETAEGLTVTAEATRNSMVAQIRDIVRERGLTCEIEALVDELIDTWGTCDIDTIPDDILTDMFQSYESVSSILAGMDA